jgi:effector-binding domain-containing protein
MAINIKYVYCASILFTGLLLNACGNNGKNEKGKFTKDSTKTAIRKETRKEPDSKYQRPPIVNIVDTVTPKMLVIYSKDSAATFDRISLKLGKIYGVKLVEYIKKNNLKTAGAPMAWYKKQKAPYFFEAGIPVNKKGNKPVPGVQMREMSAGKAVIAHFYGPFNLLPQGYDAIKEWMKDNKKIAAGPSYEIYVTDPIDKNGKPVDPYKIQTDIIFPIK